MHPGDNWDQIWSSVKTYLPQVKARVAPNEKFGVCLRLAAPTVEELVADAGKRADLKHFFADNDLYLYTCNAFVYGVFKNQVIKEQVYEPDWATDDRTTYTMKVADLLAELAPEGMNPSIQSAPLGFKPKVTGDDVVETYTTQRHAGGGAPGRAEEEDRADGDAGARAGAALLPGDDRRDGRLLREAPLLRAHGAAAGQG